MIFLLSPASCGGTRGKLLLNDSATFPLAQRLRGPDGAPIGEIFSFVSGLYFRGKLAYARRFARAPSGQPGVLIITPTRGLLPGEAMLTPEDLVEFGRIDISRHDARFRGPLERDVAILASRMPGEVILLGSIATGKYVDVLADLLGERLQFPVDFIGRGDMSRGGLLLRCVAEGRELAYAPVAGAVRHGPRPPRLRQGA